MMLNHQMLRSDFSLPDKRWVELSVYKNHHLKGHGDAQPTNTGHHSLKPEHTCRYKQDLFNYLTS